jgi:valyl-tRNA synthetase
LKLDPKKKIMAEFATTEKETSRIIQANREAVERFAVLSELRIVPKDYFAAKNGVVRSTAAFDVRVTHSDAVDAAAEITRLKREMDGLQKAIAAKERQLGDETFRSRAPEKIVKGLEGTLAQQRIELGKLQKRLRELDGGSQAAGT